MPHAISQIKFRCNSQKWLQQSVDKHTSVFIHLYVCLHFAAVTNVYKQADKNLL